MAGLYNVSSSAVRSAANGAATAATALGNGASWLAQTFWKLSVLSTVFVRDTLRAYYNLLGQYTFDIERILFSPKLESRKDSLSHDKSPVGAFPQPPRLNFFSFLLFPIGLPVILLSITLIPFIANSILSFKTNFLRTLRAFLPEKYDKEITQQILTDKRARLPRFYGIVGAYLGSVVIGVPVGITIFLGRIFYNSILTGYRAFSSTLNFLSLHPDDVISKEYTLSDESEFKAEKNSVKFGLGFPGLVIGSFLGGLASLPVLMGRVITNTIYTINHIAQLMMDVVLHKDDEFKSKDTRELHRKIMGGILGYPLGGLVGALGMGVVFVGRVIIDSGYTGAKTFCNEVNYLLHEENKIEFTGDKEKLGQDIEKEKIRLYGFGLPGYLVGSVIAVGIAAPLIIVGRLISNNWKSMYHTIVDIMQTLMDEKDHKYADIEGVKDDRHWARRYFVGFAGTVAGTILGSIAGASIIVGRTITNSTYTFRKSFIKMLNKALDEDHPIDFEENEKLEKNPIRKNYFGAPGFLLGNFVGAIVAGTVIFPGRSTTDVAQYIMNFVLDSEDAFNYKQRSFFKTFILGFPGAVIGTIAGLIGGTFIFAGRILTNSVYTFGERFSKTINVVLHEEDQINFDPALKDNKLLTVTVDEKLENNAVRLLGFGLPGLLLGIAAGLFVGQPIIIVGRIITNTAKTTYSKTIRIMNKVIDEDDQIDVQDPRSEPPYRMLGILGVFIGLLTGSVAMTLVVIGRTFSNSAYTFQKIFSTIVDPFLHSDEKINFELKSDIKSSPVRNIAFGWLGYVTGTIFGVGIGVPAIAIGRIITNSAKSIYYTIANFIQVVTDKKDQEDLKFDQVKDKRSYWSYALGLPGLPIGLVMGGMIAGSIVIGRILNNSAYTFMKAFKTITDQVLHDHDKDQVRFSENKKIEDSNARKAFGLPGYFFGGVAGVLVAGGIVMGRLVTNTAKSWVALSKSLMNLAFERKLFYGVGSDERAPAFRAVGSLGYLLAATTTAPLALGIYVVRQLPTLFSGVLGIIFSPVVLACKAISKAFIKPARFSNVDGNDPTIQGFKNLYSMLGAFGDFETGKEIPSDQLSGEKSTWSFVRKCLTFDIKTPTERLLDAELAAYKAAKSDVKENFFNKGTDYKVADDVKDYYKKQNEMNCFSSADEIEKESKEVDRVKDFIHEYMVNQTKKIPGELYQGGDDSWSTLFWNAPVKVPAPYHGTSQIAPQPYYFSDDVPPVSPEHTH